jgi:hypothetical protein
VRVPLDAIQIHGGVGYTAEAPLEKLMRDAKMFEIGGGTNEIQLQIDCPDAPGLRETWLAAPTCYARPRPNSRPNSSIWTLIIDWKRMTGS